MQDTFENPEIPKSKRKISPLTIGMGVVIGLAVLLSLWFLFEPLQNRDSTMQESGIPKMNPIEHEYSKKI